MHYKKIFHVAAAILETTADSCNQEDIFEHTTADSCDIKNIFGHTTAISCDIRNIFGHTTADSWVMAAILRRKKTADSWVMTAILQAKQLTAGIFQKQQLTAVSWCPF